MPRLFPPIKFCIVEVVEPFWQLHMRVSTIEVKLIYMLSRINHKVMRWLGNTIHGSDSRYVIVLFIMMGIAFTGAVTGSVRLVGFATGFLLYNMAAGFMPLAEQEIEGQSNGDGMPKKG